MITRKKISSISYNTEPFLKAYLDRLYNEKKISFYAYVKHRPEEDEKKAHIHFFVEPCDTLNTNEMQEELIEPITVDVPPLKSLPFRASRFDDWYLYNCHDRSYLFSKGQSRKYHYDKSNFVVSEELYFTDLIHQIDLSKYTRLADFIELFDSGMTLDEIIRKGKVPVNQFLQYKGIYQYLVESNVDPETGEYVEHTQRGDKGEIHE